MFFYSFIFPLISIVAIIWFVARYIKGKNALSTVILWSLFWIFVSVFALFPQVSNEFAKLFGITRGLDFIIILVFVILFYTVLKMYFIIDEMQDNMNKIVKEFAISNEITLDDEEE